MRRPGQATARVAPAPRRLLPCALAALLALGCVARPRNQVALRYAGAAGVREVVLLPLNVVIAMPSEVEPGADIVEAELLAYLKRQGKSVRSLGLADARAAWLLSAQRVMAHPEQHPKGFEGAAQVLARSVREGGAYDALIVPAIVMRPAKLSGEHALWDGVRRRIETFGRKPMQAAGFAGGGITSPSLLVFAFSPEGDKVFEGMGGLDLVHAVEFDGSRFRFVLRPEIFPDRKLLDEGIAIAFDPFLPRLEPESR